MKKPKKAARSIRPLGRSPVIAVRVPGPLYERITKSAKDNGRSMSEEMAALIQRGFDWTDAYEAGMLANGFQRLHGTPRWVKLPKGTAKGFLTKEQADTFFDHPVAESPLTEEAINEQLDEIDASLDRITNQIRSLRQKQKGAA